MIPPARTSSGSRRTPARRREYTAAVLVCAAAAGMVLVAAARPWAIETTPRPAPLPPATETVTGGTLQPWLGALGVVALAGVAALLATRRGRPVIGLTLVIVGVALLGSACHAWLLAGQGHRTATILWPVTALGGGLGVTAVGVATLLRGREWPSMGTRYDRLDGTTTAASTPDTNTDRADAVDTTTMWDALDRGEDPTTRS